MTWTTFGFGGIGGAYLKPTSIKNNKIPLTLDRVSYIIDDDFPFIPGTLKVTVNGVSQIPNIDYLEGTNNRSFTWISSIPISVNSSVVVDYIV
jgi:hypothetical protein